jgi:hypothetical protein
MTTERKLDYLQLRVGLLSASHFVGNTAADEASTAFETYDAALQEQLSLCVEEQQVHGCP